jgi:hypothetical protein
MSFEESHRKISEWLEKCAELRNLDFNPDARITDKLNYAIANRNCFPISLDNPDKEPNTLRTDNYELYKKIVS